MGLKQSFIKLTFTGRLPAMWPGATLQLFPLSAQYVPGRGLRGFSVCRAGVEGTGLELEKGGFRG